MGVFYMGRIKNTEKNIKYGYISILITTVLSFISRSVFVKILGTDYLGANGLFTNILNVLSFAELGIGVYDRCFAWLHGVYWQNDKNRFGLWQLFSNYSLCSCNAGPFVVFYYDLFNA